MRFPAYVIVKQCGGVEYVGVGPNPYGRPDDHMGNRWTRSGDEHGTVEYDQITGEVCALSFSFLGRKCRVYTRPVKRLELVRHPCGQNEFVGYLTHVDTGVEAHKRIPWATLHRVPKQEYDDVIKPWYRELPLAEDYFLAVGNM